MDIECYNRDIKIAVIITLLNYFSHINSNCFPQLSVIYTAIIINRKTCFNIKHLFTQTFEVLYL